MSSILITNSGTTKKGFKKKTLAQKVHIGANSLIIFIVSLICVISLIYLVHSNQTATKGYILKELQREKNDLAIENEIWDMKISRARSLSSLQNNSYVSDMVRADEPIFVRGDSAFAKN